MCWLGIRERANESQLTTVHGLCVWSILRIYPDDGIRQAQTLTFCCRCRFGKKCLAQRKRLQKLDNRNPLTFGANLGVTRECGVVERRVKQVQMRRECIWRFYEPSPERDEIHRLDAQTLWLNRKPERVFDSGCKRGLSAEADRSTVLKTRLEAGSLITE